MRFDTRWNWRQALLPAAFLPALLVLVHATAEAQIYTCTDKDGRRVFSDEKCGPDARVLSEAAQPVAKTAAVVEPTKTVAVSEPMHSAAPAAPADAAAANEVAITPEAACEAGSLRDCEERYCRDGISEECRQHVLQTAKMSTDSWYLREQGPVQQDGTRTYAIRCMTKSSRPLRDLTIACSSMPGPNRCSTVPKSAQSSGYARLDKAAAGYCSAT